MTRRVTPVIANTGASTWIALARAARAGWSGVLVGERALCQAM
jgi:hypothetical protein